jgi:hydroxyethylthiazole kinase-like uncharacterized protein yjeF
MLTSREVAVLDANAAALGVSRAKLMESAGNAVAAVVREVADADATITVVAGRGNNGGDGFVAARFLDDLDVEVQLLGRPESIGTEIARENWDALTAMEVATRAVPDVASLDVQGSGVIVDALLGTGVTGTLREPERSAVAAINDAEATVVSVDVPSGVDADTGAAAGPAVAADRVVTFHEERQGMADREDVTVADIGIPAAAARFTGPGDRLRLERDPDAHKGDFGRVFVIGGGPYTGAPALSGQAALRAGADLAYIAAPEGIAETIQGYTPDLIAEPYEGSILTPDQVPDLLETAGDRDVVILGPGLGDAEQTQTAVSEFLGGFDGRAVIDADALQVVPSVDTDATLVCTPHQGELREMGGPSAEDWEERAAAVESFAAELGQTLLVKGRYDVISDGEWTRVNRTGNPGMTVGGTGDVLAGVTGALLAVLEPREAAALGAYANGTAGDAAHEAYDHGLLASDLLDELPAALWGEER